MKTILTLLIISLIGGTIYYCCTHPDTYYALKNGVVIDKYRSTVLDNKYSREELILVVEYDDGIRMENVTTDTFYKYGPKDHITLNREIGDNPRYIGSIIITAIASILYLVFMIEDPGPPDYYTRMSNVSKKKKPNFNL